MISTYLVAPVHRHSRAVALHQAGCQHCGKQIARAGITHRQVFAYRFPVAAAFPIITQVGIFPGGKRCPGDNHYPRPQGRKPCQQAAGLPQRKGGRIRLLTQQQCCFGQVGGDNIGMGGQFPDTLYQFRRKAVVQLAVVAHHGVHHLHGRGPFRKEPLAQRNLCHRAQIAGVDALHGQTQCTVMRQRFGQVVG